jgi:DNA-binding MarR family transcriptional regulator
MKEHAKKPKGSTPKQDAYETMDALTFEMALVVFRLTEAARELLGQGKHSSGKRSVLKSLGKDGPQTVPYMARLRSVSRQHVQKLVNGLLADGLVEMRHNPRHKRSMNVTLSPNGEMYLEQMKRREREYLKFLAEGIPDRDLEESLRVVRTLREKLDSEEGRRALS